jgi:hypothetical protein
MKKFILILFLLVCSLTTYFWSTLSALGTTYTVCTTGCDYTSIVDAFNSGLLVSGDTVKITTDYVYDQAKENTNWNIPADVTLECEAGVDAIGDSAMGNTSIGMNSGSTLKGCTLDNFRIDLSNNTNTKVLNNTFVGNSNDQILVNNADTFEISGNIKVRNIIIGTSDNGLINNNFIDRHDNNITILVNSIAPGPIDYTDDASVPNNLTFSNNTINDYTTSGGGDWLQFTAGKNISFTGNTVQPKVTTSDSFYTMLNLQNSQISVTNNLIIMPDKDAAATNGTWAINLRSGEGSLNATVEHNTIIFSSQTTQLNSGESCVGMYDSGGYPANTITLNYNYNICYNGTGIKGGQGIQIDGNRVASTSPFVLSNSHNAFYNIQTLLNDYKGVYTSLDTTTQTKNPIFRTENADPTDDYTLSPISAYIDADGSLDIGNSNQTRTNTYLIDNGCTVDYATCFSHFSSTINNVVRSGDTINIGSGTYAALALPSDLSNITLSGNGSTIIDASTNAQAIALNNLNNSKIENLIIKNAIATATSYKMFAPNVEYSGRSYNTLGSALFVYSPDCNVNTQLIAPYVDVTNLNGISTSSIGLFLVHIPDGGGPGFDLNISAYLPSSVGTTPLELQTNCGQPTSIFDSYANDVLVLNPDATYSFNSSALSTAGISIIGTTTNPYIQKNVTLPAGIYFANSSNNNISNITFADNITDVLFDSGSIGNNIYNATFSASTTASTTDVKSFATGTNNLFDLVYTQNKIKIAGAGNINIYYTLNLNATSSSTFVIKNSSLTTLNTLTADATGFASSSVLSAYLSSPNTLTTQNPLTITVASTSFLTQSTTTTLVASSSLTFLQVAGTDPVEIPTTPQQGSIVIPNIQQDQNTKQEKQILQLNSSKKFGNKNFFNSVFLTNIPNLQQGVFAKEVAQLQKLLNELGYTVSVSGPGSTGNETSFFGPLTRNALVKFQTDNNIFPAQGYFGPITKKYLQSWVENE